MKRIAMLIASTALLNACGGGSDQAESQASPSNELATSFETAGTEAVAFDGETSKIAPSLRSATGSVDVWVELAQPSPAMRQSAKLEVVGEKLTGVEARTARAEVRAQQAATQNSLASVGAHVLGRVQVAHNMVAVRVNATQLRAIALLPGVTKVNPVRNFQRMLPETVPYVGATAAHAAGRDGRGVRVGILDSGIDYTHAALGGPGTLAAYQAAYADPADPAGLFPTAKVVGGYDFVGEQWTGQPDSPPLKPDPDPIDAPEPGGGHGTHVAHIAGGIGGVAPGALLYAIKVCSAVSTSCSGVAIGQAFDFALDPNGDGDISDALDVINLSLGSPFGLPEDSETITASNVVQAGVVVVTAAGNSADVPYIAGSPSVAPGAISVANTQVPSAVAPSITLSPAAPGQPNPNLNTAEQPWAPVLAPVSGLVVYVGRGCPAGSDPSIPQDDPYLANPSGRIALIDRGVCAASLKTDRAADAGAIAVIIVDNVAAPVPPQFSFGGGDTLVPTVSVTLAYGNALKALLATTAVNATIQRSTPLVGSLIGSSSRGPAIGNVLIKPEIGAPGSSVSAVSATGTGTAPFSGTSGAAPMVTGAAAILRQEHPTRSPMVIKALLMNSAETSIRTNPTLSPDLAPISRIGAGELRVNRALALEAAAWVPADKSAALSFGFHALTTTESFTRVVRVQNLVSRDLTFNISSNFRFANDEGTGAVALSMPSSITVSARGSATFTVTMTIDPSRLPTWTPTSGGPTSAQLTEMEVDGYVTLSSDNNRMTLPWHVLPRRAAALVARPGSLVAGNNITIANPSATTGRADIFALTGTSPRHERPDEPDVPYVDLRAVGVRHGGMHPTQGDLVEFAITTYGARSTPIVPAGFSILIDVDRDGTPDYEVFNAFSPSAAAPTQSAAAIANLRTGQVRAAFLTIGGLNTSNMTITVPLAWLQDPAPSPQLTLNTQFDFTVDAYDNYFTGDILDQIETMTHTLARPHFTVAGGAIAVNVPPGAAGFLGTAAVPGGAAASPSQLGALLIYSPADPRGNNEADIIRLRERQ